MQLKSILSIGILLLLTPECGNWILADEVISPAAVACASGPAFPRGRANGNPPDAEYAAPRAIDGDPATFCCLLDDTPGGTSATTIPANASEPVTGHIVFDLGRAVRVTGARLTGRSPAGAYNPRQVDFFYFADDDPGDNPVVDDLEGDADVRPLVRGHTFPVLGAGVSGDVSWDPVRARYIGLRVNSSYESGGPVHYNFQIGEMAFFVDLESDGGPPLRPASIYEKRLQRAVATLRAAVDDLTHSFPDRYPGKRLTDELNAIETQAIEHTRASRQFRPVDVGRLTERLDALKRRALVDANPLVPRKLLFVKRYTYSPGWYYAEFMRATRFGGNLCILSLEDGKVTELVPDLAGGIFDRCDLSFDARHVVFGYKAGQGRGFRLYEVGIDGTGLRQVTFDPPDEQQRIAKYWHPRYKPSGVYRHHTDDFHPCYLPDGGIAFASTRCEHGVLCAQDDSLSVNVLYRVDGPGSEPIRLSRSALSESTPSVMNDGRVLYTRWEYVDKGVIAVQALWAMHPDGSCSTEVYGNQIEDPPVLIHGRAVPGFNHLFVATATMHHPFAVGPILQVDTSRDVRTHGPIDSLTPDTGLNVQGVGGFPHGEKYTHLKNGRWVDDNIGPLYSEPYPLADPATGAGAGKYFLVDCNPDKAWNDPAAYGLYLIDCFGNRVLLHDDPEISCWQPIPLVPRRRPPVLPPAQVATAMPSDQAPGDALVLLSDVYRGLEGIERGEIKFLRVLEQVPRPWSARRFWPHDEALGQHAVISKNAHIFVKIHHGVVPVREDGSACFFVPARKNLFFQALDEEFMEVERMRSFVSFRPGEKRSCIGCHEERRLAPPAATPVALSYPPSRPVPCPGETVPRPIHYVTDVQPVLDKHCVECHNPERSDGDLDLSGELTTFFNRSYENIMDRKLVAYIQEFQGPQPRAQKTNVVPLGPKALGSHASRLITVLREGHYDVRFSPAEMLRLITWADANAPYYGSYFGRRNLTYKDHLDFRPVPTLESAEGIMPRTASK